MGLPRLHLAAALLVCQALTCATAATFGTAPAPAISRAAPAELYGALEVGGYAIKPAGYIKSVPGMVRSSLRQFRTGISGMWNNFGEVRRIQKRVKQTGVPASYPELLLIRKSGEDTTKFLQTGTVWFVAPELFCAALYFFPRLVPSTFETDAGRAKRYRAMSRLRTKSVVKLITHVEDQWVQSDGWARAAKKAEAQLHASLARQVLTGGSEFAGLRPLTPYVLQEHTEAALTPRKQRKQMRKSLDKLPTPLLNAACGVVGLSDLPIFGWRRSGLTKHLTALHAEDAALSAGGMRGLSEAELIEACYDRGMGVAGSSSGEMRRQLQQWLQLADNLVVLQGKHVEPQPLRMRLAALAAFGVATTRRAQDNKLVRLLLV